MALSRKFLTALGLEGDKVDEIISAHSETVDALKEERDKAQKEADGYKADLAQYKKEAEKLPGMQKEIDDLKKAAEAAEAENGENAWKVKYDAMKEERDQLKTEFDSYKKDITAKETKANKEAAYRKLLKDTGVSDKRLDAVLRVTDLDKIELDDEGKIKDSDQHKKAIKEEWADFITVKGEKGADVADPPGKDGGSSYKTKDEIMAIKDRSERQKAIAENPKLFGMEE